MTMKKVAFDKYETMRDSVTRGPSQTFYEQFMETTFGQTESKKKFQAKVDDHIENSKT